MAEMMTPSKPGDGKMGCCMCKKILKILAGLALIGYCFNLLNVNPWLIIGLLFVLAGVAPFMCKNCESGGSCCSVDTKKKK